VRSNRLPRHYDVQLPVVFGTAAGDEWRNGLTVSVSLTGAVIEADRFEATGEEIVLAIALPEARGCLYGAGRIVATQPLSSAASTTRITIAVPFYRLEPRATVMARMRALHQGC